MNTGAIATRYANALLMQVNDSGRGEEVFAQVRQMLSSPDVMPSPLEDDITRLLELMVRNGRMGYLKFVFSSFVGLYCRDRGIRTVTLRTASPIRGMEEKIAEAFGSERIVFDTRVEPDLIGGFVLEYDDKMADASVRHRLDVIRSRFEEYNKRIV